MLKQTILDEFKKLLQQIIFDIDNTSGNTKLKNQYRLKSISFAIKILEKYPKENIDIDDLKDIYIIKGIGEGTIRRIKEILETKKLSEIKITKDDKFYLKMIEELEEIYGIGRNTAYKLFKEYKIKSINELIERVNKREIVLPENIMIGLKYFNNLDTNIPRKDIDDIHEFLLNTLFEIDINLFGTTCGSYRRQKDTSGDVDFIIIHNDYKTMNTKMNKNYLDIFINKLIDKNFIIDSLTKTDVKTKYMGIFKWRTSKPRRIDVRIVPLESYYSALLYFTGSKDFNRQMRLNAISMDYTLNEYGLYNEKGKMFKVNSEKEIFDLLNMEYITPDNR
jgi:DNA polymerase/3'-5' exonuclease PolX